MPAMATRSLGLGSAARMADQTVYPAHSSGAAASSLSSSGMRMVWSAGTTMYSACPPWTVNPVETGAAHMIDAVPLTGRPSWQ